MKIINILALLSLSVFVKGTWWAAAVQPVLIGFGAVLTAFNLDVVEDIQPLEI